MKRFKTLAEVVAYIMDGEDASKYRWNNDAGDWILSATLICTTKSTVSTVWM